MFVYSDAVAGRMEGCHHSGQYPRRAELSSLLDEVQNDAMRSAQVSNMSRSGVRLRADHGAVAWASRCLRNQSSSASSMMLCTVRPVVAAVTRSWVAAPGSTQNAIAFFPLCWEPP
jgi:hypothetical protein